MKGFFLFITLIIISVCHPGEFLESVPNELYLENTSDQTVCFFITEKHNYPDTLFPTVLPIMYKLSKGESHLVYGHTKDSWSRAIKKDFNSNYLSVYVYDSLMLESSAWETICKNYTILVRYDLTGDDIKRGCDFITYPPDENMKSIHMWPPYEELIAKYK